MRWLVILAIGFVAAGALRGAQTDAKPGGDDAEEVEQQAAAGFARHPLFIKIQARDPAGNPLVAGSSPQGYEPSQVATYLGLSGDGSGQTIGIVDAYDHPNVVSDLDAFNVMFGLARVCGTPGSDPANCFTFTKATPQGPPAANAGWALEIALDVQWAHSVAPKASILLVETASNSFTNLLSGIDYAAQHGASVI